MEFLFYLQIPVVGSVLNTRKWSLNLMQVKVRSPILPACLRLYITGQLEEQLGVLECIELLEISLKVETTGIFFSWIVTLRYQIALAGNLVRWSAHILELETFPFKNGQKKRKPLQGCNMKSQAITRCYACSHISVDRCSGDGTALQLRHHMIAVLLVTAKVLCRLWKCPEVQACRCCWLDLCAFHCSMFQSRCPSCLLFTDFIGSTWKCLAPALAYMQCIQVGDTGGIHNEPVSFFLGPSLVPATLAG